MEFESELIKPLKLARQVRDGLSCVALAHNERGIIEQFLAHYRKLGVRQFLVVDDHSSDGTRELLFDQPDVSLFSPRAGSRYSEHKRQWRAELLDRFTDGAWVVVPDIDEHLVYRDAEHRDLHAVVAGLEAEGAEAVQATMIDMYRDAPLRDHHYEGGRLSDEFPLFDGSESYYRLAAPRRFRRKYPTPYFMVAGGMRQRVFEPLWLQDRSWLARFLARRCGIDRGFVPRAPARIEAALIRRMLKRHLPTDRILNCTKIPLVKWQRGMHFYNGAHALSRPLRLSAERMALLHFKFTGGVEGVRYIAERGEHTEGAAHYARIVEQKERLASSPVYAGTRRYVDSRSLGGIIG